LIEVTVTDTRLIETVIPLREISEEAVHEQNVRSGHIDNLHLWWARRPLVACRAAVFSSLVNDPGDETKRKKLLSFLESLCKWENSGNKELLEKAQKIVRQRNNSSPLVLDCFAGGGAIPLEAQRAGCESYALELNPVAVLILLCTNVYPQKYGLPVEVPSQHTNLQGTDKKLVPNRLAYDIERLGSQIFDQAQKEIGNYYPDDKDGSKPVAYLWSRTLPCPNPKCQAQVPLFKQLWLSKQTDRKVALKFEVDSDSKTLRFEIAEGNQIDFDPSAVSYTHLTLPTICSV